MRNDWTVASVVVTGNAEPANAIRAALQYVVTPEIDS